MNQAEVKRKQIQLYSYVACVLILLYFGKLMQSAGLAYFVFGLESIMLFLQFCSGGIADIIGRMLRYRRKRGLYLNVCAVRKRLILVLSVISVLCFIIVFSLAGVFSNKVFGNQEVTLIIRILSPVILIKTISSILQGHFQSFGSHVQTAIVAIVRPFLYFFLGKSFLGKTLLYGEKVSVLLRNDDFHGMYGAMGFSGAIVLAEVILLLILLMFYFISDRNNDKRKSKEGLQRLESLSETLSMYAKLSGFWVFLWGISHFTIITAMCTLNDKNLIGIYGGTYLLVCLLPVLLICARFYLLYAKTLYAIKGQNNRYIRDIVQMGIKYAWSFGLIVCVIIAVLAPQVAVTFFDRSEVMKELLQKGSLLIPFVLLWIYFIIIHVAYNKYIYVIISGILNCGLLTFFAKVMQKRVDDELVALVLAGIIALGVSSVLLGTLTINAYRLQVEYIYTFIMPVACAGMIGLILMALSKVVTPHIGNEVCFYVCAILGILLYLVFLGICRVFSEHDINQIFGKIGRKCLSLFFK